MNRIFEFKIIVGGAKVKTDEATYDTCDKLFDAGCSDAMILVENGTMVVCFEREAESLEAAIESGKNDINSIDGIFAATVLEEPKYGA